MYSSCLFSVFLTHTHTHTHTHTRAHTHATSPHPPTVHGFARLHTDAHTVAGRTKRRQPKHGSDVTIPAVDVFRGQGFGAGRLGKPGRWMRVSLLSLLLIHTHTHTHSPAPTHTSMLVAVGRRGRRDPTQANMIGRQTQEARPGGQDVSEIHFLRRPSVKASTFTSSLRGTPFLPFALKRQGGAARGRRANITGVVELLPVSGPRSVG